MANLGVQLNTCPLRHGLVSNVEYLLFKLSGMYCVSGAAEYWVGDGFSPYN